MARWILSTEALIQHLADFTNESVLNSRRLSDVAVSALSFEMILVDIESDADLSPSDRAKWRGNVVNFRERLLAANGDVPDISAKILEAWRGVSHLELTHDFGDGAEEMSTEERMVVATALTKGYLYVTPERDWNEILVREGHVMLEIR